MLFLPLTPVVAEPILFFDLIKSPLLISPWLGISIGIINLLQIMLISKKLINSKIWYIPPFLYAISPWTVYLEVGGSLYIPIVTCLLLSFISFKLIKNSKLSLMLLIGATGAMFYTSILMWMMLPLLIFSFVKLGFFKTKILRFYLLFLSLLLIPLFFSVAINLTGLKNTFSNQVSVFSEVGLINAVNTFRGETAKTKFAVLGKFIENRYFYLSEHLIFNLLKHLSPVTYFTPEFKMFNFSFSPPILIGFLIPFLLGLKSISELTIRNKWFLLMILSLILPSILSKNSPDLNRLILISPGIFLLVGIGFKDLLNKRTAVYKLLFVVTLVLVFTQLWTVVSDIYLRENIRIHQK